MLLQPLGKCGHYGQACRTHHSTEPSYDPPLHHYHSAAFLPLPPHLQPPGLVPPGREYMNETDREDRNEQSRTSESAGECHATGHCLQHIRSI